MGYHQAATLTEALDLAGQGARLLAGGTDLYPGAGARLAGPVVDIAGLAELRGISAGDGLRIGACTTWSEIASAALPPACAALQEAALQVGGRQIQNAGTIGGNLCNASPAADGVPPLLALEAQVELAGPGGTRRLPLADFLLGPRRVDLRLGEVLVALHLPQSALAGRSRFEKLGARAYLVISIAMVAVRLEVLEGQVTAARVAVGACGPVARRLPLVEGALLGPVAGAVGRVDAARVAAGLSPIADVRASAEYRAQAAAELIRRAVGRLA
ncbi:FAD binding domain-containing protein [Neotabrizicola sp. sgz301269]|uniref:FAD binding domain-containing protein n=1 Tax=Neotabrizicola sp. sgz301269 TaxID=3276282 RepID=UPI0037702072